MSATAAQAKAQTWFKTAVNNDAAKMQQFQNLWKNEDATVLERLAATFELGNTDAARLLAAARDPNMPAPKEVDPFLKNDKLDKFFRTNLALAYARLVRKNLSSLSFFRNGSTSFG